MANTPYSNLLSAVLPSLKADPGDPVTEAAIQRAVIEFCADSWAWKALPDPVDVVAGESIYDIDVPNGAEVAAVMDADLDGQPLAAKALDWLNANLPRWRTETGVPSYFTQVEPGQLILAKVPAVSATAGLALTLALQPSRRATGFPSWLYSRYVDRLADGALADLMLMHDKPWSDPRLAVAHATRFRSAIASARAAAVAALGRAPLRTSGQH